jgi:hypothetical protein
VLPLLLTECMQMVVKKRISFQENAAFFGTLLALVVSRVILWLLGAAGVHILNNVGFAFTSIRNMIENVVQFVEMVYFIFNANIFAKSPFSLSYLPLIINAIVVSSFVIAGICVGIYAIVNRGKSSHFQVGTTPDATIIQVAIWSSIGTVSAFIVSIWGGALGRRYLYPLLFLSEAATFPAIFKFVNNNVLKIAVVLVFVANVLPFAMSLYQAPAGVPAEVQLLATLKEHHLTQGLGSYWVSAFTTVRSEERVVIRPVLPRDNQLRPALFLADEKWYDPANLRQANFVVYRSSDGLRAYYDGALHLFGKPDHQYHVKGFMILAWNTPLMTHIQPGYAFN